MGKLCIEVSTNDKIAWISEDLCIGCGICVKASCDGRGCVSCGAGAGVWGGRVVRGAAALPASRWRLEQAVCMRQLQSRHIMTRRSWRRPAVMLTRQSAHSSVCLCVHLQKCPFDAIMIINLPKDLETQTTHRYGPNSFKLHRWVGGSGGRGWVGWGGVWVWVWV